MMKVLIGSYIVCGATLWVMIEIVFLLLRHSPFNWYSVIVAVASYVLYYIVIIRMLNKKRVKLK